MAFRSKWAPGRSFGVENAAFLVGLILGVFLLSLPALSQTYKGSIRGVVTDTSGAVVPGATVTVTDVPRGVKRTLITNQAGEYVAPLLLPSTYMIQVSAKGFAPVERSGIELQVAEDLTVNFSVKPGTASQTVVVSGGAPLINTTSATLGGTLSNNTINSLPLNGRNFLNLLTLRPGVISQPGVAPGAFFNSENGLRFNYMGYLLDSIMEYEPFQGESLVNQVNFAGDAGTLLPIDAIQQFNVVQNPPAQYGWFPGAVVNVALKSGTNQFHGTAYAFGRKDSWDARNFYNTVPDPKTPVSFEQYGGSLGGPILKNRLFFFTSYEGQRYTVGNTFQAQVPVTVSLPGGGGAGCAVLTSGDCTQSIPDATADLQAKGYSVNGVTQAVLGLYPANTGSSVNIPVSLPNSVTSNNGVAKLDFQLTPHQQISYDYFYGLQRGTAMTINVLQPQFLTLMGQRVQTNGLHWTWNPNPSWVNDFRVGYDRFQQGLPATEPADFTKSAASYGVPTGVTNPLLGGLPDFVVSGFSMLGGDFVLPKLLGPDNMYEFDDTLSYLRGNHFFSFGVQEQHWIVNAGRYAHGRGRIRFNHCADGSTPLECYLVGEPYRGDLLQGNPVRRVNQWASSFFFQDSWHAKPTLTVDLGMRYNYLTPVKEAHGLLANFDPSLGLIQQGVNGIGSVYNADPNDWSPRFGFAWNPHSGNTVIRGGASLMYARLSLFPLLGDVGLNNALTTGLAAIPTTGLISGGTINTAVSVYPGSQLNYNTTGPIFPTLSLACPPNEVAACSILGIDRNFKNPSVVGWSLGIQHAFGHSLSLDANYVGNHGRNLTSVLDINQLNGSSAAEIACQHCEDNSHRPFGTQYPYLQYINMFGNADISNYNALQVTLNEKGFHGLSFLLGYTWSHALDISSSAQNSTPQDSTKPWNDYGSSDNNAPQHFTFSTVYALPEAHRFRPLLGGWHVTSIVTLQSGMPWGPMDLGNDVSFTGEFNDRWDFFGKTSDFSHVSASAIPYFPGGDPQHGGLTANSNCNSHATTPDLQTALAAFGCYAVGNSVMIPPAAGTFGTMGRNIFKGPAFYDWDASIYKDIHIGERVSAQFRAEFFNVLNHPQLVNPQVNASGFNDPSSPSSFGCGCATPDVQIQNPVLGSGGPRAIQLGLKLIF
jgi:hypothetical protein